MRHSLYVNNRKSEISRSFKASRASLEQFSGKKIRTAKQSNALNVLEISKISVLADKARRAVSGSPNLLSEINDRVSMFLINLEIATACRDKKQILTLKTEIKNYLSNIIKKAEV